MYVFGCSTPAEFVIAAEKYVMKGIAEKIICSLQAKKVQVHTVSVVQNLLATREFSAG
ncbi:hypothetical protein [Clostridium carboxidivorans]|uniref:hypothetical protein n=1 Tax=Clostridium carboxidivorans TaxID=217159 RepID=UPI0001D392AA|nr:hypothetical protein [Clostridium carboxidivorans]EFG86660.1 hypothetical protein CLCAR_3610 [Clostridium carboxidivorans P7]